MVRHCGQISKRRPQTHGVEWRKSEARVGCRTVGNTNGNESRCTEGTPLVTFLRCSYRCRKSAGWRSDDSDVLTIEQVVKVGCMHNAEVGRGSQENWIRCVPSSIYRLRSCDHTGAMMDTYLKEKTFSTPLPTRVSAMS